MYRDLEQILSMVAKSKKVKDEKAWVDKILRHCEIHSDYLHFVNLRSNPRMWFGVADAKFECHPFILFRQFKNNNEVKEVREFEIYTFERLNDAVFIELLEDSYCSHYDIMENFRVYFDNREIDFRLELADGEPAKFGEYNDLSEGYSIITDLYKVTIEGFEDYTTYCDSEDLLELTLTNLNGYMVINREKSTADRVVFDSPVVTVWRNGEVVPFEMHKDGQGYHINLL